MKMFKNKMILGLILAGGLMTASAQGAWWEFWKKNAEAKVKESPVIAKAKGKPAKVKAKEQKGTQTGESQEMKPKLLCKTTFEEEIEGFSISDDGSYTVVWSSKVISEDPVTFERKINSKISLLDNTGKKIWEYCVNEAIRSANISPNGNFVLVNFSAGETGEENEVHLLNKNGKFISKFFTGGDIPKVSFHEKYILDGGSLKVYDIKCNLLWGLEEWKPRIAEFVGNEEIMDFDGKNIRLYNARDGEKLWENKIEAITFQMIQIISKNEIIVLITGDSNNHFIYLIDKTNGKILQKYDYGKFYKYCCRTSSGFLENNKYLSVLIPPAYLQSGLLPGYLLFFDNTNGKLIWQKRIIYEEGAPIYVFPDNKHFFIRGSLCKEIKTETQQIKFKPEPYNTYIFDQNGNILWKSNIEGSPKLLDNGEFLIIQRGRKSLSLFNATSLIKDAINKK